MATAEDYSRSVIAASDELQDIYCEPCVDDGKQIEAEGFCVDCSEYLCGQCYKNHTRYKAFKHHVLQEKDKMPLVTIDSEASARDVCVEKCGLHQTKIIEYFCKSCDTLGCHACITVNHRQCKNVDHIPDIVKDLEQSEEFKELMRKLEKRLEAVTEEKKKLSSTTPVTGIDEMKRKAKEELKRQRDEIRKFFDHLEEDMDRRIEDTAENNKKTLKAATSACDSIQDDLQQMKTNIDIKQKNGQKCELFIAVKSYKPKMENISKEIKNVREQSQVQRYALTPSAQIKDVIKNTSEICRFRTAKLESEVNVGTNSDKEKLACICGLAVIQNHYLAVLDSTNKSVIVFDTKNMELSYEMNIDCDFVWSITNVIDDQLAIHMKSNSRNKVQLLSVSVSGALSKENQIKFDEGSSGSLVHKNGHFYALDFMKVLIADLQGNIVGTINTDYSHDIAVSPDNTTIYLTSPNENTVSSMTLDGKVKSVYKDKDLKTPWGITVDDEGLVYVSSLGTSSVHQLTEDCTKVQNLLDVYGTTITYSNTENRLYVGCADKIKVYQIE